MLAEKLLARQIPFATSFNFGPGYDDVWPVERIATKVAQLWGEGATWERDSAPAPHEDRFLQLDASRARSELGWRLKLRTESALEWSIAWYRAWKEGKDMKAFTWQQIEQYEKL